MKWLAEMLPEMFIALRPISLAYLLNEPFFIAGTYKYLLNITLFLVLPPIRGWGDLKIFKDVNAGVLP